uniref:Olfactory receptor 113 n=1 Tax=Aulacocentrum confusum TaxID=2767324 RepID=A0A7G8Z9D2_9HYME|nr:olfactory receptor 113 [Aulacocentrum confusum]
MIVSKLQWKKFQFLFEEMENYICKASLEERSVFVYYANHFGFIHIAYSILIFLAALNVIVGPIFLSQSLPCDVEYPFNVDQHPVVDIIYFLQSVQLCQCSSSVAVDCQMATLLWYLIARFEILGIDVKSVKNAYEFGCWIDKHQNLLRHAEEVVTVCKYLNLITVVLIIIPTIFAGIIVQLVKK